MKTLRKTLSIFLVLGRLARCSTWKGINTQQQGTTAGAAGGAMLGAAVSKGSIWGILAGAPSAGLQET